MARPKYFDNRYSLEYLQQVLFDLEQAALEPLEPSPRAVQLGFRNQVCIDFSGIAASLLLVPNLHGRIVDPAAEAVAKSIAQRFEELMCNWKELNKEGICLKFRFLFPHPNSPFLQDLIEAETTRRRPDIPFSPSYEFSLDQRLGIGQADLNGSNIIKAQTHSLKRIQDLVRRNRDGFIIGSPMSASPNVAQVRFSCIGLSLCMLRINKHMYCDPYLYARKQGEPGKLNLVFPLIGIEKEAEQLSTWESVENDFYYVWSHESTMLCSDATKFDPKDIETDALHDTRQPESIQFTHKESRLKDAYMENYRTVPSDDMVRQWHGLIRAKTLSRLRPLGLGSNKERIFISCSWVESFPGFGTPNEFAKEFKQWLDNDFGRELGAIVNIQDGRVVQGKVYEEMENCTTAVIFMTKDTPVKNLSAHDDEDDGSSRLYMARPNIYHELGYLTKRLQARETGRLLVFRQKGVMKASNAEDMGRFVYDPIPHMKEGLYFILLRHMITHCQAISMTSLRNARSAHKLRVEGARASADEELARLRLALEQEKNRLERIKMEGRIAELQKDIEYLTRLLDELDGLL